MRWTVWVAWLAVAGCDRSSDVDPFTGDLWVSCTCAICVAAEQDDLQGADVWSEEVVWLEPEAVLEGRDPVLEAALAWIDGYAR